MYKFDHNSKEAGNTPTDGSTSGFPSPAADYLAIGIDLNKLLIENPSSHFKAWLQEDDKKYLVIIDRSLPLKNNCRVVIWDNNQWFIKKFRIINNVIWFYPLKGDVKPILYNADEPYTILGRISKLIWMNP
jgi:DNA polymerase V